MDKLNSRIKPHGWTASEKIPFHKSKTFMDYLHGDVNKNEVESACQYEYARESWQMWRAAKIRDDFQAVEKLDCESAFWRMVYDSEVEHWIKVTDWALSFLMCGSFPHKDWNELSTAERKQILRQAREKVPPLQMQYVQFDYPHEEFPQFNRLAEQSKWPVENVQPGEPNLPPKPTEAIIEKHGSIYYCLYIVLFFESPDHLKDRFLTWLNGPEINQLWQKHKKRRTRKPSAPLRATKCVQWHKSGYWCLFEVDLSANKGDLVARFKKWLASAKIQAWLKEYNKERRGTSDNGKDWLKDLAAWRLYREHKNSCDKANQFANENRKTFKTWPEIRATCKKVNDHWPYKLKDPRPFRDAKQTGDDAANKAPLYSHDDDYRHAKIEVLRILADWIPSQEFEKPSPSMTAPLAASK